MNIWVELIGANGKQQRQKIASVVRDQARFQDFGLSLDEGKNLQNRAQQELTQFQVDQAAKMDRRCSACCSLRSIHDYRSRVVHTLFGFVVSACPVFTLQLRRIDGLRKRSGLSTDRRTSDP